MGYYNALMQLLENLPELRIADRDVRGISCNGEGKAVVNLHGEAFLRVFAESEVTSEASCDLLFGDNGFRHVKAVYKSIEFRTAFPPTPQLGVGKVVLPGSAAAGTPLVPRSPPTTTPEKAEGCSCPDANTACECGARTRQDQRRASAQATESKS